MARRRPQTDAAREPFGRTLLDWTPKRVRAAEVLADAGDMRLAADLCEVMLGDDRIQGVLSARTRGLLGLGVDFEASGDRRRSNKAIKALEVGEDWWAAYPEQELGTLLDWGILLGIGLAKNVYTEREDVGRVVPRLERYHARWLRFDWNTRGWQVATDAGTYVDVVPGDGQWVLHTPGGAHRPWADGAWRSLSRWWLLKHMAREDFARSSEVHGGGLRVGFAPQGSNKTARDELAADLHDLGADTGLVLPPGYDLKIVEAVANTWKMFQAQIELANLAISIRLAGQNLTSEVSGGSLAAAEVHRIIRGDLIRADGETTSSTLHDQSLVHWAEINFGDRKLAPWPVWPTDPPEDRLAAAQTRSAQAAALIALRSAGVDIEPVMDEFGLEAAPEPDPSTQPTPPPQDNALADGTTPPPENTDAAPAE